MQPIEIVPRYRESAFPLGASVTVEALDRDPHSLLAELREREPVSWLPALGSWYVTRRDLALQVARDPVTFTVDDPRFSTSRIVGRSMLSTDGREHARHRDPFARPFRLDAVRERFETLAEEEAARLVGAIEADGRGELRADVAGPLAVASMVHALGLLDTDAATVLGWYETIVVAVTDITAGREPGSAGADAFACLRAAVEPSLQREPSSSLVAAAHAAGGLTAGEVVSNAAVMLFGGIETTEGMIANVILHLLSQAEQLAVLEQEPALARAAVEESLRLEPAAAVVDRYATRDVELAGAAIGEGELVTVSIAGANRDPAWFPDPDRFDIRRPNSQLHLAFAQGPHVCLGMHLARIEAYAALRAVGRLPRLRLDRARPSVVSGLVFRKPQTLHVVWGE